MPKSNKRDSAYRPAPQGGGKNSRDVKKPANSYIGDNPSGV